MASSSLESHPLVQQISELMILQSPLWRDEEFGRRLADESL